MAEYIDKKELLTNLDEVYEDFGGRSPSFYGGFQNALKRIKDFPTADVAPVRHGTWKTCFEDWRKQIEGDKCSACGFEHYGCSIRAYRYCPNCGARMDGGADNEV